MKNIKKIFIIFTALAILVSCANTILAEAAMQIDPSMAVVNGQAPSNAFPKFEGKDMEGNTVDNSLFAKNEVTILNFWFNGCSACVNEMPALEKFNEVLREKGAEIVGVNVGADESEEVFNEAKEILSKQGAKYRNITLGLGEEAQNFINKMFTFPTTLIVDKNGNIVGDPLLGSIESEARQQEILKVIEDIKSGASSAGMVTENRMENNPAAPLLEEESRIFAENQEVWNKLFSKVKKDEAQKNADMPYVDFLKSQLEKNKADFTEEEMKILNADFEKIAKIEEKIAEIVKDMK